MKAEAEISTQVPEGSTPLIPEPTTGDDLELLGI
jgi:hypothetical protein